MADVNEVIGTLLDRQAALAARSEEVHRALISVVLEGGGLDDLAAELAAIVDGPVFVTTPDGRIVAQAGDAQASRRCLESTLFDRSGRFRVETPDATVGLPLVVVPILTLGRRLRRLSRENQDRIAASSAEASESLLAAQTVQAYTHEAASRAAFGALTEGAYASALARVRTRALLTAIVIFLVFASIVAFWAGEFVNSVVLAKMKLWTKGKHLWTRTIGSTVAGQGVDSAFFYPLAFFGILDSATLLKVMLTQWVLKVAWEALLTPVTYAVVGWLKRREGFDVYDKATEFTPFSVGP